MEKTRIEWAESTWNPVTGCYHECKYCYARRIAARFGDFLRIDGSDIKTVKGRNGELCVEVAYKTANPYPEKFTPTLHKQRLRDYEKKRGRNIFVCSMADLFGGWVPDAWIDAVFEECERAPQHNYLFLTKNPDRYISLETAAAWWKYVVWADRFRQKAGRGGNDYCGYDRRGRSIFEHRAHIGGCSDR